MLQSRLAESILIVDGDAGFTSNAQRALEARGLTVHVHEDAPLDLVRKLRPSVIVVNVELPRSGASGFSLCSRVRRDKQLRGTPILLTGVDVAPDAFERHAKTPDHADDYALKPLETTDMVNRIGALLAANADPDVLIDGDGEATLAVIPAELDEMPGTFPDADVEMLESAGPPPLPELTLEPWKPTRYDQMVHERLAVSEPAAPRNPSPDQRMMFLRQRVKFLEARDKAARDAWETVQGQGREMERQNTAFKTELDRRETELINVKSKLVSEQAKYDTFNDEITRIFSQKDQEERETSGRIEELEHTNQGLREDHTLARQHIEDDARRLKIFQEEIETLQIEHDNALVRATEATDALDALTAERDEARETITDLRQRLETTDTVAADRADEIERLTDRLDALTLDSNADRKRFEASLEEQKETLEAEQTLVLEARDDSHSTELAVLESKLESSEVELLELQNAHEGLREALSVVELERDTTAEKLAESKTAFDQALAEHAETIVAMESAQQDAISELKAEAAADVQAAEEVAEEASADAIAKIEAASAEHERELEGLAAAHRSVVGDMEEALNEAEDAAEALRTSIDEQRSKHDEARSRVDEAHRTETARLTDTLAKAEADLVTAKADFEGQIAALDDDLEEARIDLVDRLADLDHARKKVETIGDKLATVIEERDATAQRLEAAIARIDDLEAEMSERGESREALANELIDLQTEHDVHQATSARLSKQLDAASEAHEATREELNAARAAVSEFEVSTLASEDARIAAEHRITELESQLDERGAEASASHDRAGALDGEIADANRLLESLKARLDEVEEELESTRTQATDRGDRINALEDQVKLAKAEAHSLAGQLATREKIAHTLKDRSDRAEADLTKAEEARTTQSNRSTDLERKLAAANSALASSDAARERGERAQEVLRRIGLTLRTAQELLAESNSDGRGPDRVFDSTSGSSEAVTGQSTARAPSHVEFGPQGSEPAPPTEFADGELADSDILDVEIENIDDAEMDLLESEEVHAVDPVPPDKGQDSPFAGMADESTKRTPRPRRKLSAAPALDAAALKALDAIGTGSQSLESPVEADPFVRGAGLPPSDPFGQVAVREDSDIEDDGHVTEVVRVDELE